MEEMRILAPTGVCGSGFLAESFEKALAWKPHFIGCDAGSTDPGPSHLGSGQPAFPRDAVKRDLRNADGHGGQQYAPLMDIEVP